MADRRDYMTYALLSIHSIQVQGGKGITLVLSGTVLTPVDRKCQNGAGPSVPFVLECTVHSLSKLALFESKQHLRAYLPQLSLKRLLGPLPSAACAF